MTNLAQRNDCHCCNDARSIVQQKNLLLLVVLAGLLPQVATFVHRFTNIFQQQDLWDDIHHMLTAYFHQVLCTGRAYSLQVNPIYVFLTYCSTFQTLEQTVPPPSDGRHACSRRCQLALNLTVRGTGHLHPPPALSGRLQCGWCFFVFAFDFVALLGTIYPMLLRHFHPVVADKRATARTTVTVSHAASSQKKRTLDTTLAQPWAQHKPKKTRLLFNRQVKKICYARTWFSHSSGSKKLSLSNLIGK